MYCAELKPIFINIRNIVNYYYHLIINILLLIILS